MKVYYDPREQEYQPQYSLFNGAMVPYPDVAGRTQSILQAITARPECELLTPPELDAAHLQEVHDPSYLENLEALCKRLRPDEEFFPFIMQHIPLLLQSRYQRIRMGYYAVDGSTPLLRRSYTAALGAAAAAKAAAEALVAGEAYAYALVRPPGHHAGFCFYGGYCLINNAALAARLLGQLGKVAVLDVDFHHGNGTQNIFYESDEVLYVSVHCRPDEAYPYIAGTAEETGAGRGHGYNLNLPLPGGTTWADYEPALETALEHVARFRPDVVVLSAGFDALGDDPIGAFRLETGDFAPLGRMVAGLDRPMLIVQEGGYHVPSLGEAALQLFTGLGLLDG